MNLKRLLCLILAVCAFNFTACGGKEQGGESGTSNSGSGSSDNQQVEVEYMENYGINDGRIGAYNQFKIPEVKKLKMPDIFTDNMVFQHGKPVRVWGVAPAGSKITITLSEKDGKAVSAIGLTAYDDNTFVGELPAMQPSFDEYVLKVESGSTLRKYENIKFGEVILASGQSNMQVVLCETYEWEEIKASATNPNIRIYNPGILAAGENGYSYDPQMFLSTGSVTSWTLGTDTTTLGLGGVSAIAYSAAVELYRLLEEDGRAMPVGILNLPVGGTSIVTWLPRYTADEDKAFKSLMGSLYLPYSNDGGTTDYGVFASLFNCKIAPVVNYNIGGCLWYQGETDAGRRDFYVAALEKLICAWGEEFRFKNGKMPFVSSEIAPFNTGANEMVTTAIVGFNTVFSENALTSPETRSAVAIYDCRLEYLMGDNATIHTRYKKEVGRRMGGSYYSVAINGKQDKYRCPAVSDMKIEGNKIILTYKYVGDGLKTSDGLPVNGFAVADSNDKLYEATAAVTGKNTVEVYSRHIASPTGFAYAYSNLNMRSNLVNSEGYAAIPCVRTKNALKDVNNYCQHDYLTFDTDTVWRYFAPVTENGQQVFKAGYTPVYSYDGVTAEIVGDGLYGNCLKVNAASGGSVTAILSYPYDTPQFNNYNSFAVCAKGVEVTSVAVVLNGKEIVLSAIGTEDADNGYTRYIFSFRSVTTSNGAAENYTYPMTKASYEGLKIYLSQGEGTLDCGEIF